MAQFSRTPSGLLIGFAAAAACLGIATAAVWSVWDRIPDQIATHWNGSGPDDWTDKSEVAFLIFVPLGLTVVLAAMLGVSTWRVRDGGRITAGVLAGVNGFTTLILAATVIAQAFGVAPIAALIAGSVTVGLCLGLLAAYLTPKSPPRGTVRRQGAARPDAEWNLTMSASRTYWVVMALLALVPVVLAVAVPVTWTVALLLSGLIAAFAYGSGRWRVHVGADGITIASGLTRPRVRLSWGEVVAVETLNDVEPFEYGGWGLRLTPEGTRLALQRGPTARVLLSDDSDLIITADDAQGLVDTARAQLAAWLPVDAAPSG